MLRWLNIGHTRTGESGARYNNHRNGRLKEFRNPYVPISSDPLEKRSIATTRA